MLSDPKLFYLICYASVTCYITVHALIKKYNWIYCAIWSLYALSGVFCVLCKVYQGTLVGFGTLHNRWYDLSDTTWWGYAFLIICNLIAFNPLKKFNMHNELASVGEDRKMKNFFIIFCAIYLMFALLFIVPSISSIAGTLRIRDFGLLRTSLYSNSENEGGVSLATNIVSRFCFKMCVQFKYIAVFIAFSMFKERIRVRLASITLLVTFFIYFVSCMATAARGGLLIFMFVSVLIGMVFFPYLSKVNKRRITIISASILGVVFVLFMAITISRFANDGGGGNPILRNISFYLGHGPIEFSKITGSLDDFAYGRTIIGRLISHYFGTAYSWENIANSIGYPAIGPVFVTYLGFMYTDFGVFGCLLFVGLWALIISDVLRKRPNKISTLFLFLYYLHYYVTGNFVVGRLEYASVVTTFVLYFIIRIIERSPELRRFFTVNIRTGHKRGDNNVWNS